MRLDQYLVQHEYCTTRARAQDAIQQQRVYVNDKVIQKNSYYVDEEDCVRVIEEELSLASRAGFKLYDVLEDFEIDLKDRICIDVGASTGGFSDVCLKQGAKLVYAVDVGKDQLLEALKGNPRVINMEGVNCRYLTKEMFSPLPDFACMDVSFISIKCILPALLSVLSKKELVVLVKPQFEAGREYIGKHGVIKNEKVHLQVLNDIISYIETLGVYVHHVKASSLLGRDGNKEFVVHIKEEECHKVFPLKQIIKEYHTKR
ncbi:MAG: TlyA family RNA methyltransferase [Longicatena sp.]